MHLWADRAEVEKGHQVAEANTAEQENEQNPGHRPFDEFEQFHLDERAHLFLQGATLTGWPFARRHVEEEAFQVALLAAQFADDEAVFRQYPAKREAIVIWHPHQQRVV